VPSFFPCEIPHWRVLTEREVRRLERRVLWGIIQEADADLAAFVQAARARFERARLVGLGEPLPGKSITLKEIKNPPPREGVYFPKGEKP